MATMIDPERVRGVVFDLGGVVLRICRSWDEGCRVAGVPLHADGLAGMFEGDLDALMDDYQAGRVDFDGFTSTLAGRSRGHYTAAEVARVHEAWILGPYTGAHALIAALREAAVPTVALSNTCGVHWAQMPEFDAFAAIEHRIGSHLVGACKPAAAMYEAAEAVLPAGPGPIVFFDDLPANVEAATARGWSAHRIDPEGDPPAQIAGVLQRIAAE